MTPELLVGAIGGLVLAAGLLALARVGLRGGQMTGLSKCRFVCPALQRTVTAELHRNFRTSQFLGVKSCTAFDDPEDVQCEVDCARLMNRGVALEGPQGRL